MHDSLINKEKKYNGIYMAVITRPLLFTVVLSFFMALVLHWNHIITGTPPLFVTIDGWGQAWPLMAALSEYIWTDGFPRWHFGDGLGGPVFQPMLLFNPFRLIPILLGRDILPYAMVWMQILKIVLACLFFYLFLQKMQFHPYVCAAVSLMYAFSGHMIIRGANWIAYGVEVTLIAFLLYAVELYFRDGRWKLVPVAVFLVGMSLGTYHMYLYSLFLFTYATIRYIYIYSNKFKLKDYAVFILKCGVLYGIGALAAGIALLPATLLMLMSARGQESVDSIGVSFLLNNLFAWNPRLLLTAFFRLYSGVTLGAGIHLYNDGDGVIIDMLEAPLNYAGILMIVLVPAFFYYANNRLRKIGALAVVLSALYHLSPTMKIFLSAFIDIDAFVNISHFKLSSFWITIVALVMAAYTLDKIIRSKNGTTAAPARIVLASSIGLATTFMVFGLLAVNYNFYVDASIGIYIILFLLAYGTLLYYYISRDTKVTDALNKSISKHFTFILIFFIIIFELFSFSNMSKSHLFTAYVPQTLMGLQSATPADFLARDSLIESIENNDEGFYRIAVNPIVPIYRTKPLADGFFGSSFYSSLHNRYIDFLDALNTDPLWINSHPGLLDRYTLQTLTAHKYLILDSIIEPPYGFSYLFSDGDRSVYLNDYYLPLGFAYDTFITREQFDSIYSIEQKDIALLSAVVLETSNDSLGSADISKLDNFVRQVELTQVHELSASDHIYSTFGQLPHRLEVSSTGIDPFVYFHIDSGYEATFIISVDITSLHHDTFAQIFWATPTTGFDNAASHMEQLNAGERTTIRFTVDNINLSMLRIDPGDIPGDYIIENLTVEVNELNHLFSQFASDRRAESFEMTRFSHNHIAGTIETFGDRMLFFSIPNEAGWRLYINGENTPIETVNIGFIGALVGEGFHHIELRYRLPGLVAGGIMTSVGLAAYVVMLVLDKKRMLRIFDTNKKTV